MAESKRHKELKTTISHFFKDKGWSAKEEFTQGSWRADCFVEKGERRAAIEIELSKPSVRKIIPRIEAYERDGVASIWLVARNSRFPKREDLPIFPIEKTDQGEYVYLEEYRKIPIKDFLEALSQQNLKRRTPEFREDRAAAMMLFGYTCYNCQKNMSLWQGLMLATCACGKEYGYSLDSINELIFEKEVEKRWDPVYAPFGPPAFYKKRRTSLMPIPYLAAHCPHCNYLQGEHYVSMAASSIYLNRLDKEPGTPDNEFEIHFLDSDLVGNAHFKEIFGYLDGRKHWCYKG